MIIFLKSVRNFLIILSVLPKIILAQTQPEITKVIESSAIKLAYHNSFLYPGLRLGAELPITRVVINKSRRNNKVKTLAKDRFLTGQFSWYYHPGFHSNYYLTIGATSRRTKSSGFFIQGSLEIGYSRTFLAGTTYEMQNNGSVERIPLAGGNYFAFLLGTGVGYDLSFIKKKPFKIYLAMHALLLSPYNSSIYPRAILETGVIYQPKKFLQMNNRLKTKSK